jgi:type VI secretion system protein ImpL
MAFAISYGGNRRLERQVSDAARGITAIAPNNVDFPPVDAMRRLDTLRAQIDTLSAYEREGAPLSLRWGLYSGSSIFPDVRRAYFAGFNRLMFANTKASLLASLRSLPDSARASDDYGSTYSLLKSYLITTTHPEKSTAEFLAPVLMKQWQGGRPLDPERTQIAQRQFETYARELQFFNPFPDRAEEAAVARGRAFLRQFAGSERIYQFMLAEANKASQPIQFNKRFPGSAAYLVGDIGTRYRAFTKAGFTFMQDAITKVDRFRQGRLGRRRGRATGRQGKAGGGLHSRYARRLRRQLAAFPSIRDDRSLFKRATRRKLTVIGGNQSRCSSCSRWRRASPTSRRHRDDLPASAGGDTPGRHDEAHRR